TYTDPFGHPLTFKASHSDRPYLVAGIAVAGAVVISTAIESYFFARNSKGNARALSVSLLPAPSGDALALRVSIRN
ncbi:MAG: hypothetical protein M3081_02810, partial [Gemmatimonadota bacterium]|nr:hypothetical protein [Gemmatimonadota bacterium]